MFAFQSGQIKAERDEDKEKSDQVRESHYCCLIKRGGKNKREYSIKGDSGIPEEFSDQEISGNDRQCPEDRTGVIHDQGQV